MATNGVNNQVKQNPVYDEKFLNDAKPKNEKQTESLFKALWDEAARIVDQEADANNDGVVDKQDLSLLNKLVLNLQKGQKILAKNMDKFKNFDPYTFKRGFEACEQSITKAIENITNGTYISPKEAEAKRAQELEEQAKTNQAAQTSYEPDETDAEQFNTPYYRDLKQMANNRLDELQKEKDNIARERKARTSLGLPFYYKTPEEASKDAMNEIVQIFLGTNNAGEPADKNDANCLIEWANTKQLKNEITISEKSILVDAAKEFIGELRLKEAREQAQAQDNSSGGTVDNQNSGNGFWQEYSDIMHSEGHSHRLSDDLNGLVGGYSKEEAQAVLSGKEEDKKSVLDNTTLTRHLD